MLHSIEKKVKNILHAKSIVPLRHSNWVENLVLVRKKNGEIRLCVDFWNLNRASLKDNYAFPKMHHILQKVVGSSRLSMIDGFSRYIQIVVHPNDQKKTTFKKPWGNFMYSKMHFSLTNARDTLHGPMDIVFVGENDTFVVIYLDDIRIFLNLMTNTWNTCSRLLRNVGNTCYLLIQKGHIFLLEKGNYCGTLYQNKDLKLTQNMWKQSIIYRYLEIRRRHIFSWAK